MFRTRKRLVVSIEKKTVNMTLSEKPFRYASPRGQPGRTLAPQIIFSSALTNPTLKSRIQDMLKRNTVHS
jgi:hypothetical protein